jgi:hypothetical protein
MSWKGRSTFAILGILAVFIGRTYMTHGIYEYKAGWYRQTTYSPALIGVGFLCFMLAIFPWPKKLPDTRRHHPQFKPFWKRHHRREPIDQ